MVFSTRACGQTAATGAMMAAAAAMAASRNRAAARLPSRTAQHGRGHDQGGPRGRLGGRGDAQDQPGHDRLRTAPEQRQAQAQQGQDRDVGPPHGQREGDHRGGRHEEGPAQHVARPRDRQGGREHGHEAQREPDPRVGDEPGAQQRPRQPEDGHDREVRVVDVGVVRGGDHGLALVGGTVLEQEPRTPRDHAHLRLPPALLGQHRQRRDQRPADPQEQGHVHGPRGPPGQHDPRGQHVSDGREQAPQPVQRVRAEHAHARREERAGGKGRGQPRSGDGYR